MKVAIIGSAGIGLKTAIECAINNNSVKLESFEKQNVEPFNIENKMSSVFPFLVMPDTSFMLVLNPIFIPAKHSKQSYAAQNRLAKKRRKQQAKKPK